ncbi:Glutamate receptor ionotropic, kainate 1 [Pseudolycoriella hygida]|uniref:Glutamate receptor ionotropic, kainate 1 n=1 Tax=Pseudolycoriella hygida TaxID=35572 RepID=A0A9Q0RWT2_9DIPT|nr:Glutamate receptor ionotropic, kainate 1 [Pseudolycoriella hygida]KAJ6635351.1 Glutamate receptor ionotropic, kainate 1 [Pseudolycoriella hygida]
MALIYKIFLWISLAAIGVQCQSLKEKKLVVLTVLEKPYTSLREVPYTNLTGNDRYEGYIVDLLDSISNILGFKYELVVDPANTYGSRQPNGKWNGMVGDIIERRADVAAAAMTINAEREAVVDFTVPFMNLGIGILYQKAKVSGPGVAEDFMGLLHPFTHYPVDTFFILTLLFGIILLALRRKYKTIVFRTFLGFWLLFLFIYASLFIAQLTDYYIKNNEIYYMVSEFRSVEDLVDQNFVAYGCIAGGATMSFFRNSNISLYSKMWSQMASRTPSPFVASSDQGIERVREGGYAFLAESTLIEYVTARVCELQQVGGLLDSKGFGLAVQQGSALREVLSKAILSLQEQGILIELKKKWWYERGSKC